MFHQVLPNHNKLNEINQLNNINNTNLLNESVDMSMYVLPNQSMMTSVLEPIESGLTFLVNLKEKIKNTRRNNGFDKYNQKMVELAEYVLKARKATQRENVQKYTEELANMVTQDCYMQVEKLFFNLNFKLKNLFSKYFSEKKSLLKGFRVENLEDLLQYLINQVDQVSHAIMVQTMSKSERMVSYNERIIRLSDRTVKMRKEVGVLRKGINYVKFGFQGEQEGLMEKDYRRQRLREYLGKLELLKCYKGGGFIFVFILFFLVFCGVLEEDVVFLFFLFFFGNV